MGRVGVIAGSGHTARELMVVPSLTVAGDGSSVGGGQVMTEHRRKVVPVADEAGRLLGIIDDADLLLATHAALRELIATGTVDDEG